MQVPTFSIGDTVRVISDEAEMRSLQEGHGGWVDDMRSVRMTYCALINLRIIAMIKRLC